MSATPPSGGPAREPPPLVDPTGEPPDRPGPIADRGPVRRDSVRSERWTVRGVAKVTHDVDAGQVDLDGVVSVAGSLAAASVRARGTLEVFGRVEVRGPLVVRGDLHVGGPVRAVDLDLDGPTRLDGELSVERRARIRGSFRAPSLSGSLVEIDGSAVVPGDLRAAVLRADLTDSSELGTVTGRTVRVHGRLPNLLDKAFFREPRSVVRRIEADSVDLAAVRVAFVRSREVVLGAGAHVTTVEGTIVRRHSKSHVGPESESPAPYGLRR